MAKASYRPLSHTKEQWQSLVFRPILLGELGTNRTVNHPSNQRFPLVRTSFALKEASGMVPYAPLRSCTTGEWQEVKASGVTRRVLTSTDESPMRTTTAPSACLANNPFQRSSYVRRLRRTQIDLIDFSRSYTCAQLNGPFVDALALSKHSGDTRHTQTNFAQTCGPRFP